MTVTPVLVALRSVLALVFAVSACTKLADRDGFKSALGSFGVPERLQVPTALLVPILELVIAIGLLPAASAWVAAAAALALLLVFTTAIVVNLMRGRRPDCHCFGQLSSTPVSWRTVLRNGVLMGGAAVLVAVGPAHGGPSLVAWVATLTPPEALGLAAVVVVAGVMSIETWVLARVLRQNGRLVLRLDALEATLTDAGLRAAPSAPPGAGGPDAGLPMGAPAPTFRLNRPGGGTSATAELLALGKPLALAFVDPQCGPCTALLPELALWQQELTDQITLVVITTGTVEANNSTLGGQGLDHVLVQKGWEVSEAYQAYGTPSMVLVGADGTIGSPIAAGRDSIRGLMASFASGQRQPDDTSRLIGAHLAPGGSNGAHGNHSATLQSRIGLAAPDLRLPGLDGKQVSLAAFRGHSTLVLFWNPACGFCQSMLNELHAWEANRSETSPQLLVVSTGSVDANRAMGLRSPVVLETGFTAAAAFGAGGTPSAVLVDEHGRIASAVGVGATAVLALAAGGGSPAIVEGGAHGT